MGQASFYDQFMGEYKKTAFGYGEENQSRMTDNLNHLVTPILKELWFGEGENKTQNAMGYLATDQGVNPRSIGKFTSNLAGLVGSVVMVTGLLKEQVLLLDGAQT